MNSTIEKAINYKFLLELRYHNYFRIVEPYAYGRDKNGDEILRCFQISGGSESGENAGWKLLKVGEVFSLECLGKEFTLRHEYRRNDKSMLYMFCQQ